MNVKSRLAIQYLFRVVFGLLFLHLGGAFFIEGTPLLGFSWELDAVLAGGLVLAGIHDLYLSCKRFRQLLKAFNGETPATTSDEPTQYGYRDQWEQENL